MKFDKQTISQKAKLLFDEERSRKRLDGWFIAREIVKENAANYEDLPPNLQAAHLLKHVIENLPLEISHHAIFAGTQRDAFAKSYALINPSFTVENFSGYCDPTAVFNDIEPNAAFTADRIEAVKKFTGNTKYVQELTETYREVEQYTEEVAFFIEQVTGHTVADFKPALKYGINSLISEIDQKISLQKDNEKINNYKAMKITLQSVITLANRYRDLALKQLNRASGNRRQELELMIDTLHKIPQNPCFSLYEAVQCTMLLWQVMCLEQAPNPFAFSLGNADRIFEPYRQNENLPREIASALFEHLLVFFNVGDRSWAISQNVLIGGKSNDGVDLTNEMSYAILDAFFEMNFPQPILSVKLHENTPQTLYESLGKFFFTPGVLTPSLFNDDVVFFLLEKNYIEKQDLENYSVAGCQEPLIMGKDNGNTTNSWLNLAKILELSINNGTSLLTNKKIGFTLDELGFQNDAKYILKNIRQIFYKNVEEYVKIMCNAANKASCALSNLPVPFLSAFMGGVESGYDMRDVRHQGTKYNGSGCLIHGLSVIADSFVAIDALLQENENDSARLLKALSTDFKNDQALQTFLKNCPKYGNNNELADNEAREIANRISDIIAFQKNYLGNSFRPDWSSPSTHLLYGYRVAATPDGRNAGEMLGYGIDPLYGEATNGLGFRVLSMLKLPYEKMSGGVASHLGINPNYFKSKSLEEKGTELYRKVICPLFFSSKDKKNAPYYIYMNVTTAEILRKVLAEPKKYAPSGVYIMRIHGTFVNFLDLSPDIQEDIIKRLDQNSTKIGE